LHHVRAKAGALAQADDLIVQLHASERGNKMKGSFVNMGMEIFACWDSR
jgi:hypothetical protein